MKPKAVHRPTGTSAAGEVSAAPVPATRDWSRLRKAVQGCRACPLWQNATCAVFGDGPRHARIMLVGEQPGDQEDRAGKPFVGPAGHLLDRALAEAGLVREDLYVTNAVKHFKWTPRGKRRLHAKPGARELAACRPWLAAEVEVIAPELIVCLGATAAQQVVDRSVRVARDRGARLPSVFGPTALVTVHPSSLLRHHGRGDAEAEFAQFVADLRTARATGAPGKDAQALRFKGGPALGPLRLRG